MSEVDLLQADFARAHPDAFARALIRAQDSEIASVLERLPKALVASVVARLPAARALPLLESSGKKIEAWMSSCPFDDAVALLSRVPRDRRLPFINAVSNRWRRQQLLRQQRYPAHTVGSLVRDIGIRLPAAMPSAEALETIAGAAPDPGPVIVVDSRGRFLGGVDLLRLATGASPSSPAADFVVRVGTILPETSIAVAAEAHQLSPHNWLFVADHQDRILGAVERAALLRAARAGRMAPREPWRLAFDLAADAVWSLLALLDTVLGRRTQS